MSEYKDKIDQMRWSYSRLTSFGRCKYEFYLNYIVNDDEKYLSERNYYAEVGSFMHDILAKILNKYIKNTNSPTLNLDEAAQYYVDNFDNNVFYKVRKSTMDKTFEMCADYLANLKADCLKDYEVLGVELKTEFKINGYDFIGFIDLLLRDKKDNALIIVDHKSLPYPLKLNGEVKKNFAHSFEEYKKQMYLYSFGIKEKYGEFPKMICWNHFKDNGKIVSIPFKNGEYEAAVKWFIDTIHEIESEEDFSPTLNYFYCTNLCDFRNCCEYRENADWKCMHE